MSVPSLERMTPDEFFVWQAEQDRNYELVNGLPVLTPKAMTGASLRHDDIVVNILTALHRQLRSTPCRPHTDDIAVRNPNQNVRRPDVVVDGRRGPDRSMEAMEPRLLVEVLSPSTMAFDRFKKVEEYKTHLAIRTVLLVASEHAEVILWQRQEDGWRSQIIENIDAVVDLPEIGCRLTLAEIYEDTGVENPPIRTA
ncbi:Uma2 family endonuclease [Aurantimonas sp. MSK8Z-1]|uniref:Uma2 family endonuclease n=1 Tax=Mangrovibrevibacter kandeliae TaxID=2968473 RepID=UPI0021172E66|nr:Uma2 family endonuclease [Aurantimonas sp. MSK8Z-1]MCW4116935.1 Uma2 family endonuclease [Aurantimonas sp. MSK8Z-1]